MRRLLGLVGVAAVTLLVAPAAIGTLTSFSTPSRNIGCIGDGTRLRCDISRTATKPPPKPHSCRFDWGNYFELKPTGRPRRICVSDSAAGSRRILRYGQSTRMGRITCTSRTTGLTCRNPQGHGFFLSRQRVRLF